MMSARRTSPTPDVDALAQREKQVADRVGELHDVDFTAMAAVSNVYRVAGAVRNLAEREILAPDGLSWTGFTALWVLWIWGPQEARHLADECGVTKGTLTGIVSTLSAKGLLERSSHPTDGRLVLVGLTPKGRETIRRLFPLFNQYEAKVVSALTSKEQEQLANLLRKVLGNVEP
jgi:MarR family transcriptional regulator, organic hydroperoxide resistance regulator